MPHLYSLLRSIFLRLLLILLLAVVITALGGVWIHRLANERAAAIQQGNAEAHYVGVISGLEQRWGKEAYSLRVRLESLRFLESATDRQDRLLAHLISLGQSLEFPMLRVEDIKGDLIASYDIVGHATPRVRFRIGQESIWAFDEDRGKLFMVIRQSIWLGKENGYLILYKPVDHALLSQLAYPGTELSLWWRQKPVASSSGRSGIAASTTSEGQQSAVVLRWPGADPELSPSLRIDLSSAPVLKAGDFLVPVLCGLLAFLLGVAAIFGPDGARIFRRAVAQGNRD